MGVAVGVGVGVPEPLGEGVGVGIGVGVEGWGSESPRWSRRRRSTGQGELTQPALMGTRCIRADDKWVAKKVPMRGVMSEKL